PYALNRELMVLEVHLCSQDGFHQPQIGGHVVGYLRQAQHGRPCRQRRKDDELVSQVPIDRRAAGQIVEKSAGHKPTDGLSGTTGCASLVGPKQCVGPLSKEGEGGPSLRRCGLVEETELSVDTLAVEDLLAGARHALTDLALLQV